MRESGTGVIPPWATQRNPGGRPRGQHRGIPGANTGGSRGLPPGATRGIPGGVPPGATALTAAAWRAAFHLARACTRCGCAGRAWAPRAAVKAIS